MAVLLVILLLLSSTVLAQQPAEAAATAPDPTYKLLVENPSVRAVQVTLAPGQSTRVHEHERDLMLIAPGVTQFTIVGGQGRMKMSAGEVQVLTGASRHAIKNDGREPLRLVVIELSKPFDPQRAVCGLGERACGGEMGGSLTQGAFVYSVMFETDSFRVVDVTLDPGAVTERFPIRGEHLMVPITPLQLRKEEEELSYEAGQAIWAGEGFTTGLENTGKEQARWVAVEVR